MPEVDRTVQILCRRSKNNPLYVGDPGVGKTAIAEGLARKIIEGDVPEVLKPAVIYALDMGALLAGTRYRGDFEERLKQVVNELEKLPHAVLFIDEIHTVIGAGATSGGAMDASNLLKPALAQGTLRCIGSTTYKEYRQYFEKDRALVRRFPQVFLDVSGIPARHVLTRYLPRLGDIADKALYGSDWAGPGVPDLAEVARDSAVPIAAGHVGMIVGRARDQLHSGLRSFLEPACR